MERDDDYSSFVADMWAADGIPLNDIAVERGYSASDRHLGQLVSLVEGAQGRLYVNVLENGVRKTYRPEMHRWWRDGLPIHLSAFDGVRLGFDPDTVLACEYGATSLSEATLPAFDRFSCPDRRWAVQTLECKGHVAFVVVSKVRRLSDKFTARSHFRFGHREEFLHAAVLDVVSVPSMRSENIADFLNGKRQS